MPYAIAHLTITNPDMLAAYREKAGAALAKHGGKIETATAEFTPIEGNPNAPQIAALLSFPSKDDALAWVNDPELQDIHALRRGAGQSDILFLG